MKVEKQVMILYAGVNNNLSDIKVSDIRQFEEDFFDFMDTHHRDIAKSIIEKQSLTEDIKLNLNKAIEEFKNIFLATE